MTGCLLLNSATEHESLGTDFGGLHGEGYMKGLRKKENGGRPTEQRYTRIKSFI